MKEYCGKTKEEALEKASQELNVPVENIYIVSEEEEKGFLGKIKEVKVTVYTDAMIVEYVVEYIKTILELAGLLEITLNPSYSDGIIKVKVNSNNNSILIGKNGRTLQAINEITRSAASAVFKRRVRVLLDINEYKEEKYSKIISIAKREAYRVQKTKITAALEPMSADERRVIHNALVNIKNVKTVSVGEGKERHITIEYVG